MFLAVNIRENAILANAPPDKMAVIEQTISVVDVAVHRGESLLGNVPRLRVYRLTGVAPETLVKVLRDVGGLDPSSRLEVDSRNKAVIANAPLADHVMIQTLVERLDGTGRRFEVIQLRLLKAENVAGSIELPDARPGGDDSRSRYPYYIYDPYGGGSQQQEKSDKFQVDADIEHNRLLLRATEAELAEVRELLVKLGEVTATMPAGPPVRSFPHLPAKTRRGCWNDLKRIWPSVGPNQLDVEERPTSAGGRAGVKTVRRPRLAVACRRVHQARRGYR